MPALSSGVQAPDFKLPLVYGKDFSLQDSLKTGPVVAAFFKVSCPVCQLSFPYLERLFRGYGNIGKVTFVGISQDSSHDTQSFNREFGVSFSAALDTKAKYPVSNSYGLTNVPSIFLIAQNGEIESSIVGWSKKDMEDLNRRLAEITGAAVAQLFGPGEKVPDYKPG